MILSSVYFPRKFTIYRCDRKHPTKRRSGGVALLVHHSFESKPIAFSSKSDSESDCEFLAIEIITKPQPLIIYVCYMNKFDLENALKHHQRIKSIVERYRDHRIMVLGDFNLFDIVWTPDDEDNNVFLPHTSVDVINSEYRSMYYSDAMVFLEKMMSLPLFQLSNFKNKASNVLDLVFVNRPDDFMICDDKFSIIERSQQDACHIPYEINVDYIVSAYSEVKLETIYQYSRGNYERMCQQLESYNFEHEFKIRNVDDAYEFFCRTMIDLVDRNVPRVTVKKYANKQKWWTPELQRLKNRRDKLFKRRFEYAESMNNYVGAMNEFADKCRQLEEEHHRKIQENIKSNPSEFWKFATGMKLSRIVPVYKRKGSKSDVKNYRVIAIQPIVMKICDVAVKRKINGKIQAFEHSCQLDVFYGDFKTAFDKVWIRLLMIKFARFGFGIWFRKENSQVDL